MSYDYKPSRTIYSVGELKLNSFLVKYSATMNQNNTFLYEEDYISVLLQLGRVAKFRISKKMIYSILRKLEVAINWFYDPEMKDLFVVNEKGELMFNNDYNNLMVSLSSDDNQHMEIRPVVNNAIVERGKEGVIIFMNRAEYFVVLDREDFEGLYHTLKTFSFQEELILLLNIWDRGPDNILIEHTTYDLKSGPPKQINW